MEEQLEQIQLFFKDQQFEDQIDSILEQYLQKTKCEFTEYQKSVFPICAAYYAIIEAREIEAEERRNIQETPETPKQGEANKLNQIVSGQNKENIRIQQRDSKIEEEPLSNSSCHSPSDEGKKVNEKKKITKVSIMELRNQFYKKGQVEQLLKTMTEFSQVLQGREYSEIIQSKLESTKRNYSLFIKFSHVLDYFYRDTEIFQKHQMQSTIWRLYLLLKEQLHREHSEVDIEQCAYLLHFISSEALIHAGKTLQIQTDNSHFQNPSQSGLLNSYQSSYAFKQIANLPSIQEQVNAILLKSKLEQQIMKELQPVFSSLLAALLEKIYKKNGKSKQNQDISAGNTENKNCGNSSGSDTSSLSAVKNISSSAGNLDDEEKDSELASTASKGKAGQNSSSLLSPTDTNLIISNTFSQIKKIAKLSKLLEKEIYQHEVVIEEHEFLLKEEHIQQSLVTPKAKPITSMLCQQGPPGVTKDYNESKYQNSNLQANNVHIPKKTLTFNDDVSNLNLNSKLSDFERPLPSPVAPFGNNQLQGGDIGFVQQPLTPKMPNDIYKMPNTRNPLINSVQNVPSTPVSTALDNSKWINMYSKSDPTKKIEELMNKIDKEYRTKLLEEVSQIARDVFYNCKKKNEVSTNLTDGIEYRVQKTVCFFQNVLEKMICDEEQRNCREGVLISLLENKNFIFSLLANCIMTFCYVKDIKGITLELVIKQSKITSLDYWRVISNFAKFDKYMPEAIKEQLFYQEKQILLYTIWEEKDLLMQNALKNFQDEQNKNHNYEKVICKRLISHSATRVREISKILELNEEIQERVWEALLYVYRSQLQLMNARYVDQIIICSIYALKLIRSDLFKDKEIKFKGMISSCEKLLHFNYEKVKKTTNEQGESIDIINFYNKIYLNPMKQYFKSTNVHLSDVFGVGNQNSLILNCSLKNSIPPNFINYTPLLKEEMQQQFRAVMTPMTPVTQKLQATENLESPYPHQQNNFLSRRLANKQSQFMQFGQNAVGSNLININQQKIDSNLLATKTVTVLGQNYSNASIENINGNLEKKSSRKLNFEGDEKGQQSTLKLFENPNNINNQSSLGGTPTLEQKQSSPAPTNLSPKFGCGNSSSNFIINQSKKLFEDSNDDTTTCNFPIRTLKRCDSIFGPKSLHFNSDDENIPSKTNTNTEGNGKNIDSKEDH